MIENLTYYPRHGYRETHRATQDGYPTGLLHQRGRAAVSPQIGQDATVVCLDWDGGRDASDQPRGLAQHAAVGRTRSDDEARRKQKRADN